ncbi:lariat debranching enzyme [Purpureocillium takamizusanense]|uniref:Lariat debranching enzyme n=1 Tax=Purpureocillium takamizusanense TaxID=2060973 RepID=A0A9Q8QH95_9HYPO|nr:lariat debranching enzyme [Purpureocillium takamizusanense]UNI19630.1 lariat debranching enzyme [Purpureocillium takamizusanense]
MTTSSARLKIAVVGCGHGKLDTIYATAEAQCRQKGWSIADLDLLLICGDFQAVRNAQDLNCMSVPRKYRELGDFHKYYSGAAVAPVLTLVIGGNHEASNYLFELYHGGWLAPKIYYLGAAGVVRYGPLRVAGLSGIYQRKDYRGPHHERLPYERDDIKSVYHVREYDVEKLLRLESGVDIAMSHDWPSWVELFGDYKSLFASHPHFLESASKDGLGSFPATELLNHLRPAHWFSAHMHHRFTATIQHTAERIEDTVRALPVMASTRGKLPVFKSHRKYFVSGTKPAGARQTTKFLALDKFKEGRPTTNFLNVLEIDVPLRAEDGPYSVKQAGSDKFQLCYDEEWLAITRAYNDALRVQDTETLVVPPDKGKGKRPSAGSVARHREWVRCNIVEKGLLEVPRRFAVHAPVHDSATEETAEMPPEYPNVQTARFAALLKMENRFAPSSKTSDGGDSLFETGGQ